MIHNYTSNITHEHFTLIHKMFIYPALLRNDLMILFGILQ